MTAQAQPVPSAGISAKGLLFHGRRLLVVRNKRALYELPGGRPGRPRKVGLTPHSRERKRILALRRGESGARRCRWGQLLGVVAARICIRPGGAPRVVGSRSRSDRVTCRARRGGRRISLVESASM